MRNQPENGILFSPTVHVIITIAKLLQLLKSLYMHKYNFFNIFIGKWFMHSIIMNALVNLKDRIATLMQ